MFSIRFCFKHVFCWNSSYEILLIFLQCKLLIFLQCKLLIFLQCKLLIFLQCKLLYSCNSFEKITIIEWTKILNFFSFIIIQNQMEASDCRWLGIVSWSRQLCCSTENVTNIPILVKSVRRHYNNIGSTRSSNYPSFWSLLSAGSCCSTETSSYHTSLSYSKSI